MAALPVERFEPDAQRDELDRRMESRYTIQQQSAERRMEPYAVTVKQQPAERRVEPHAATVQQPAKWWMEPHAAEE